MFQDTSTPTTNRAIWQHTHTHPPIENKRKKSLTCVTARNESKWRCFRSWLSILVSFIWYHSVCILSICMSVIDKVLLWSYDKSYLYINHFNCCVCHFGAFIALQFDPMRNRFCHLHCKQMMNVATDRFTFHFVSLSYYKCTYHNQLIFYVFNV